MRFIPVYDSDDSYVSESDDDVEETPLLADGSESSRPWLHPAVRESKALKLLKAAEMPGW